MDALFKQVREFDDADYFTDEQLATAKRQLEISNIRDREVTSNYVHTLSFYWASASLNYFFGYINNVDKVTRKDIQDYIRKYIKGKPFVAGLLLNPALEQKVNPQSFFNANHY
ncbi:MAG: insulinase family protein, partial [Bacteroidota bacterium]|nr:insulinase family protein [Bacteroidota bacterium]